MLAAIVRRMRDLDRSNKWLIVVLALLATHIALEALFSHHDAPFSVFEFANLALLTPVFLWVPMHARDVRLPRQFLDAAARR